MARLIKPRMDVNRFPPAYPRQAYRTYTLAVDERRLVGCQEASCGHWADGWLTTCDLATPLGRSQAELIRSGRTGRRYVEGRMQVAVDPTGVIRSEFVAEPPPDGLLVFRFWPGQKCFRDHWTQDGPERYWVRDGDWRGGNLIRRHTRATDWTEDYNEQQARRAAQRKRG